jgi:hypothetical protein
MKRVLVISYSQTGQLEAVVRRLLDPLEASCDVSVRRVVLEPVTPYPFPWPLVRFST